MNRFIIKDIGPIKHAAFDFNQINVIMGPQSSGKSTIAKIVSYCQWVEKRYMIDGKFKHTFEEEFIEFHRIDKNYFNENSFFEYESDFVKITYKGLEFTQEIQRKTTKSLFQKSKNIYIPAERNFVSVIPNLQKYKETDDNIMSFLHDWLDVKKRYSNSNKLGILDVNVDYQYDKNSDSDKLLIANGKKEIHLKNASSGLQSVIPLLLLVDYLCEPLFEEKIILSYEEKEERFKLDLELEVKQKEGASAEEIEKLRYRYKEYMANIQYQYSNFIIEEPEQNLFPKTQRDLLYFILEKINASEREHQVLLTTHSPYILYALNNCMMGHNIKDAVNKKEKSEFTSADSWFNPEKVSIWEIEDGTLRSIKDAQTGTVTKHYFNKVMNEVMSEYYDMLDFYSHVE